MVVAGAEPLSPATRMEPGAKGWLARCGLPSRPLEARALLKRGAIACPPLLRFNAACPSLPAAALPTPPMNAGRFFYGDVSVGTIALRSGNPADTSG